MTLLLITAPATEPLSLQEAKSWLRVDATDEVTLIQSLIVSARMAVEAATGRLLITQQWRLLLDCWPEELTLRLPLAPVRQVLRITIADAAGDSVTTQASQYRLDGSLDRARLVLIGPLPTPGVNVSGISIDVTVGYGEAAAVPEPLRLAMRHLIALWFANRRDGDVGKGVLPAGVQALLAPHRIRRLA